MGNKMSPTTTDKARYGNNAQTITTLEIAEMMDIEHWELLRKLDGRTKKDGTRTKGYIEIINDNHLAVVDFFIKSSYLDSKGEERPCYEATKLGCDFLANKFTGEKGILFTAKYVKRFHEMEQGLTDNISEVPLGELASYLKVMDKVAVRQNLAPHKIAENFKKISARFGIELTEDFVKIPEYHQIKLEEC